MMVRDNRKLKGYEAERKEAIEWIAMLSTRSNFLSPGVGKSTAQFPVTPADVAHAIASSNDKLGAAVAVSMACQRPAEWPVVHELGYPLLCSQLTQQLAMPGVIAGARRFRARIVLYDAFASIATGYRRAMDKSAAEAKIQARAYRFIHKTATSLLQSAANAAAADAVRYLFSRMDRPAPEESESAYKAPWVAAASEPARQDSAPMTADLQALLWLMDETHRRRDREIIRGILTLGPRHDG